MSKAIYEMAKKYYPRLWNDERLDALKEAGKLTDKEYKDIKLESNK